MTETGFPSGWYPLLRARDLGVGPVVRHLFSNPIELGRTSARTAFGRCLKSGQPRSVAEHSGWVFAALDHPETDEPIETELCAGPNRQLHLEGYVCARISDVAENILDTTHTSVVHQDYLRRPGDRRCVEAQVSSGDGWIAATYPPGAAPSGWGARLLGAHQYTITDTFRAPAIAEVTYSRDGQTAFAARFRLTPAKSGETYVAATLCVPGTGLWAGMKLAALKLFFQRIFSEDREILELIGANRAAHGSAPLVFAPQDVLRPGIDAILSGRTPRALAPRVLLKV